MTTDNLTSMDDVFLQSLKKCIYDNLEHEQFGVQDLSNQIGLSRSQIHRRLYKIHRKSVTQYIREIRLEEAVKLLSRNVGTAAEIAYRVGFSSPTYFNKCFHDYFGYPPGKIRRSNGTPQQDINISDEEKNAIVNHFGQLPLTVEKFNFNKQVPYLSNRTAMVVNNKLLYVLIFLLVIISFLIVGTYFF